MPIIPMDPFLPAAAEDKMHHDWFLCAVAAALALFEAVILMVDKWLPKIELPLHPGLADEDASSLRPLPFC
jgi:hypothetical protein